MRDSRIINTDIYPCSGSVRRGQDKHLLCRRLAGMARGPGPPAKKQNPGPHSARGMNPSSSEIIIVRFRGEVNISLRRSPARALLATFPTGAGKAVDPTGFEPAPWNMTGSCAADYTTGPEGPLGVGRAGRKSVRHTRR